MRAAAVLSIVVAIATTTATARAECSLARRDEPCLSPWLDEGAPLPGTPPAPAPDHRVRAAAIVGGLYVGFSAWAYYAWYRDVPSLDGFRWGHDGFFGRNTYAGGADKLGHAWATYVLARATTGVLRGGGWGRTSAVIAGSTLSWALFLAVEVKDGFYYRFSPGDFGMNTAGAALSALMVLYPRVDELFDYRVEYAPSDEYIGLWRGEYYGPRKGNSLNIAEDYSGATYFVALHLGALPTPRLPAIVADTLDYLDVGVGFETRRYKPDAAPGSVPTQRIFVGVALDLQHVFDRVLGGRPSGAARAGHAIGRNLFEYVSLPYTIAPVLSESRAASGPAPEQ